MGRIRKFTQEAYDALQSGVSDDGEILDFFSDIPLNISNFFNSLELEDDLSNFQSYLRDISDFENYMLQNCQIVGEPSAGSRYSENDHDDCQKDASKFAESACKCT